MQLTGRGYRLDDIARHPEARKPQYPGTFLRSSSLLSDGQIEPVLISSKLHVRR